MKVAECIVESLRDADAEGRENALDRLGALRPDDAVNLTLPLLSDPVVGVRESAATCLGTLRDERAIPHLIAVVGKEPEDRVRAHAIMSLSYYESDAVRRCLLGVLAASDASNLMRMKAAFQLWKYDDDEVMRDLERAMLTDEDRNVRLYAADSLYLLFCARGRPAGMQGAWRKASADDSNGVRRLAQKALDPRR